MRLVLLHHEKSMPDLGLNRQTHHPAECFLFLYLNLSPNSNLNLNLNTDFRPMASYISIDRSTPSPGPKERQDGAGKNVDRDPALRYRIRGLFLIALYFPLLLIPWAVTLVIADRPFSHGSYIKHSGFLRKDIITVEKWVVAINVLNSIASIVTIPILSALLAQAAVVYSQRRSHHQHLSVRHLFALADRGWSDLDILYNAWRWKERGSRSVRTFLYLALGLILTSKI